MTGRAQSRDVRPLDEEDWRPLAPAAERARRIASLGWTLVWTVALLLVDRPGASRLPENWPLPPGYTAALAGMLLLARALVWPSLWYRHWRYAVRARDVLLRFGVIFRTIRSVPRERVQHVDLAQGPVLRLFGLYRVTLYTAGSGGADASIPGLEEKDALALRDELLETPAEDGERSGERPHG